MPAFSPAPPWASARFPLVPRQRLSSLSAAHRQEFPHEMHLAALPRGAGKGLTDCRNQPGVSIGNDKPGRRQTTVLQILKQHSIGASGFFGYRFNGDDVSMSISVHTTHNKHRHADNSSIYSNFFVQCIHPQNRVHRTGKRAITELLDLLIQPLVISLT